MNRRSISTPTKFWLPTHNLQIGLSMNSFWAVSVYNDEVVKIRFCANKFYKLMKLLNNFYIAKHLRGKQK